MASQAPVKDAPTGSGGLRGFVDTHQQWISLVMRVLLAVMWFKYSLGKLGTPESNAQSVRDFRILPESLVTPFGYAQPYFELALGLLLILGLGTRLVALMSALLLLVYIGGIISLGARGIAISCGCGGSGGLVPKGHTRYTLDVIRDLIFMIPAVWLVWKPASKFSLERALLGDPI
ncbi:DoxX family membrane protein [Catenulispora subtropica]|uniref:DoxX family membrane protein n=2 Tax=Catenulispora subtropica TaxID=450798 RepID=A0ABP5EQ01_9ACTN